MVRAGRFGLAVPFLTRIGKPRDRECGPEPSAVWGGFGAFLPRAMTLA